MIYQVNNVSEAVELAEKEKRSGKYDWFRGQQENWPLISSFLRLDEAEREREMDTIGSFVDWVKRTDGLEYLRKNDKTMLAVAQHHGLKTNFIDFTTDPTVAGYFASENAKYAKVPSCIMCLNTSDLLDFWKVMPPTYPPPELIYIDVPNLWRLEAQKGVFLFCPYYKFENIYNLDRILFPPTETVPTPTRMEIYPRKSNLEELLDQWIMTRKLKKGTQFIMEKIAPHETWINLQGPGNYPEEEILAEKILKHSSWRKEDLEAWMEVKHEKYQKVKSRAVLELEIDMQVLMKLDGSAISELISAQLMKKLRGDKDIREKLVHFQFSINQLKKSAIALDDKPLEKLWDGLRCFPYEDWEIAEGIANCAVLQILSKEDAYGQIRSWEREANNCFGETIEVEFGCRDGSYSRGFVSKHDLFEAVRSDLEKFLKPEYREIISSEKISVLLQFIYKPDLLFDFRKLASLFARQICPIQVLTREFALFYSPARLDSFGLP